MASSHHSVATDATNSPVDLEKSVLPDAKIDHEEEGSEAPDLEKSTSHDPPQETHAPEEKAPQNPLEWDGPDDPDNPMNWPLGKKIYHAVLPGLFGFAVYDFFPISSYMLGCTH